MKKLRPYLFLSTVGLWALLAVFAASCKTSPGNQAILNPPEPTGATIKLPNDTSTTLYFLGFSGKCTNRQEAETGALNDAKLRISGYIYEIIQGTYTETSRYKNDKEKITEDTEVIDEVYSHYTQSVLEGIKPETTMPVSNKDGSVEVQIVVPVARTIIAKAREDLDRQIESLSAQYSEEIIQKDALSPSFETLRMYRNMQSALDPLQRLRVEYISADGKRQNLYAYLNTRVQALANSLPFNIQITIMPQQNQARRDFFSSLEEKLRGTIATILVDSGYTVSEKARYTVKGVITCSERETNNSNYIVENSKLDLYLQSDEGSMLISSNNFERQRYPGDWFGAYNRVIQEMNNGLTRNFMTKFETLGN